MWGAVGRSGLARREAKKRGREGRGRKGVGLGWTVGCRGVR